MTQDDDPRQIISVSGKDREHFLQGIVTNDVGRLKQGAVYAAILTPQGKYLADFFLVPAPETILVDVAAPFAAGLMQRLAMYRLRADVRLEAIEMPVSRGTGPAPDGAFSDPRHPALGWRHYGTGRPTTTPTDGIDWDALRVAHVIPQSGIELIPNESYPLEMGFERLHGIDFRKGCYVGQEVTARMKHKTELRKGLAKVRIEGTAAPGSPILTADGREAGVLHTVSGDQALAYLRFDRATQGLHAGTASIALLDTVAAG
jgi:tRNA-modifying protein YgfZ